VQPSTELIGRGTRKRCHTSSSLGSYRHRVVERGTKGVDRGSKVVELIGNDIRKRYIRKRCHVSSFLESHRMGRRSRGSINTHIICHIIIVDAFTAGDTGGIQEEEERRRRRERNKREREVFLTIKK
jgi:hypothetical protein